jgi:hypothetical protein
MFSGNPYSALPYSADGRDVRGYFDMTMDLSAQLTLKIWVSTTAGYATLPTDSIPNQPFRGVLQSFSFDRSIMQQDIGQFTTGTGTMTINNQDANYDFLPLSYAIDGRPITLKIGDRRKSYDDAFPLARLTATGWNIATDLITVNLVDFSYKLNVPMQTNVYGGSGDADGGADVAGKRKPLVFGNAMNISPLLVVPSLLIYQAHDGAMQSIDAVYDRGVPMTSGGDVASYAALAAASVAGGHFVTCLALGLFKLGTAASGTVTSDVKGDNSDGYIVRTADIVRWALRNRTTLDDPDDLDTASFDAVNAAQPAPIDYFIGPDDSPTVAAFIQNVMGGIGGWGGHRLDGTFEVRIFSAPTGNPVDFYTRQDMIDANGAAEEGTDPLQRLPLPDAYNPPRWRWRVPYARSWTVQTDLAGAVTSSRNAFVSQDTRLAEASSVTIQTDHPFAQDADPVQAYFSLQADAQTEAVRLIALWKTTRAIYQFPAPRRALRRNIGDEINVTHPRFDLSHGRSMIILETSVAFDFTQNATSLDTVVISAYG